MMPTTTLVTSVYLSKAEALDVLERELGWAWITDDPAEVTLALPGGATLSIEVPHYGEELPLTLDIHHDDQAALEAVAARAIEDLSRLEGWNPRAVG